MDPIKGVGQKSDTFWTQVHENFLILSQKHFSENCLEMPMRTKESIEPCWKKKISKCVQHWYKFYRQLKSVDRSGWNKEKCIEEAGNLYSLEVGEIFKYAKCVPVLQKLPKFDPIVGVARSVKTSATIDSPSDLLVEPDADDKNDGSSAAKKVNNSGQPQGSDLARSIGMKKAKKLEKVRSSSKASIDPSARTVGVVANELLVDMSAATKDLVASFKASSSMKHENLTARKHDKWMKIESSCFHDKHFKCTLLRTHYPF